VPRSERKKYKVKLLRRIKTFDEAARGDSWKGGGPPENIPNIEELYRVSKSRLINFAMSLYDKHEPLDMDGLE